MLSRVSVLTQRRSGCALRSAATCIAVRCMSSAAKVRVYASAVNDPFFNYATEDYLFRQLQPDTDVLYLWQNNKTVFIGRNQNPWKETIVQNLERDHVNLVRRTSGGGAVYQDLGNVCWTFLSSKERHDKHRNNQCLVDALGSLGMNAEASGRNDIVVSGAKVSGAAFRISGERVIHHGTMLLNVDLEAMTAYLNPNRAKLQSKGVSSVKARVMNLASIMPRLTADEIMSAIKQSFCKQRGLSSSEVNVEELEHASIAEDTKWQEMVETMKDWNWRFGKTPDFEHNMEKRFDWGSMDVHVDTKDGVIRDVRVFSDSLYPDMVDLVEHHLRGARYSVDGIGIAMTEVSMALGPSAVDEQRCMEEFSAWLQQAL